MAILLYIFLFSWTFMYPNFFSTLGPSCVPIFLGHASWACHLFSLSFFLNSPCLIWRILERERSLNMEFYFVNRWNGIANFQCRSLAGGVHMILIKQVWKTSHWGHKVWWSSNATTRHICVRFVSWRLTYGFGRTNTWSCRAMEVFFLIKIFPDT